MLNQLAALGQRRGLHSHPRQHAPDRAVVQGPFLPWRPIPAAAGSRSRLSRAGRLAVGLPVVLQVAAGKLQEGRPGVTLIGQQESRDNP